MGENINNCQKKLHREKNGVYSILQSVWEKKNNKIKRTEKKFYRRVPPQSYSWYYFTLVLLKQ